MFISNFNIHAFLHFLRLTSNSATGDLDKFTCIPLSIACCSLTNVDKSCGLLLNLEK